MATRTAEARASTAASTAGGAILAAAIGLGVILMAGFVQADALHNAAHDMRHATGLPCH